MKKSILGLAVSAMFMMGAAQAETNTNDVSATLTVSGSVTTAQSCAVNLSKNSINLNSDVESLPTQGSQAQAVDTVDLSIAGDDLCASLVSEGKMAYQFLGTADNANGTSLANNASSSEGGAGGIGIALYDAAGKELSINKDTVIATPTAYHLGLAMVKLEGQEATAGAVQSSLTIQIERL